MLRRFNKLASRVRQAFGRLRIRRYDTVNNEAVPRRDVTKKNADVPLTEIVRNLRCKLVEVININHGLLDELLSLKVLTREEITDIESEKTDRGKIRRLLRVITTKSSDQVDHFLVALNKNQQSHVVYYIRAKGIHSAESADDWPVCFCEREMSLIDTNRPQLIEFTDTKLDLLVKLLAQGCLSNREKCQIEAGATDAHRNEWLYEILSRKRLADFRIFIRCLVKTKQYLIVSLLTPDEISAANKPISTKQKCRLMTNYEVLLDIIDAKTKLVAELYSKGCLTDNQKEYIESAKSKLECNTRLLNIIRCSSNLNYIMFIECLANSGQRCVCTMLETDSPVALIVAKNRCMSGVEDYIVSHFMQLIDVVDSARSEELRTMVNSRCDDAQLRVMNQGHSIGLFYHCLTLNGLQTLHGLFDAEQLVKIVEHIFKFVLNNNGSIQIRTLIWEMPNYVHCAAYLHLSCNLPTLSMVYRLAGLMSASRGVTIKYVVGPSSGVASQLSIHEFPFELIEMILIRTAGHLFKSIREVTPHAERYTLATLGSVSFLWWTALTYRKFNRRFLKRYFQHVCHPYNCNTVLVSHVDVEGVLNIAEWEGELFVVCGHSSTIKVFSSTPPFQRLEDILVSGLNEPSDIVTCSRSSVLYIADVQCAIWRVNLLATKRYEKYISTDWEPHSMSVNIASRLVLTPRDGDSLFVYGDDGDEICHVELPRYMHARHAVEMAQKTFIVCHSSRLEGDVEHRQPGVTEVDISGRVIRTFNNRHQIKRIGLKPIDWLSYLVLDNNHVIVTEKYNRCITLLSSDLTFKRVMMTSLVGQPRAMCLSQNRYLFVCYCNPDGIDVCAV